MNFLHINNPSLMAAVLAGTLTGIYNAAPSNDILRTIILAAVGAFVSFLVSSLLSEIKNRFKR